LAKRPRRRRVAERDPYRLVDLDAGDARSRNPATRREQASRSPTTRRSTGSTPVMRPAAPTVSAGGALSIGQADPGWRPNLDSSALAATQRVYTRLFGRPPAVTAVHAWLETAVIGDRVGGLDMVSFGPRIEAPHSPGERVSIPTVDRFWRLLTGVVDGLSAG
jgi:di/tripeptidase